MRPYSASVRLCSRTSCGVIGGSPGNALGVPPGEVFLFVATRLVGHRTPGVEGDLTVSVSPPGRAGPCGGVAAGEDDCPLYPCPGQRSTASTTCPFWRNTTSSVPQVYSQPL